jgi:hypothetical protein
LYFFQNENDKAGKVLKQENSEAYGAVKASLLTRETNQVAPVAQNGSPRA